MEKEREPRTPREKYGEELRIRRVAANMTQEALSERVVCSPTLISHFEAGRRTPKPDDAQRIDQALGTDGFFVRWLVDLESKYADHFANAAVLEPLATEIRLYGLSLIPGLLQTDDYARAVLRTASPNYRAEDIDRRVVNRIERARILDKPLKPVVWTLLDEAVLRRQIGGPQVMAEQLHKIADMAEAGRIRLHVLPFAIGSHALVESMVTLMSFTDAAPVAYVEGLRTGHLMDDPAVVSSCRSAYDLAVGDAVSHQESLALVRATAEEFDHGQR
ncbi:helix-turn-helix domain-containing protein [Streptomyces noursei]|uniref:Transcriptional regulator n=1 Tax=Streptomyces noursei TaxID=1971 RepID=A0A059W421_STRNR|nr:helix-turn-helix transcriptional regulator [Streptomyces noursei]AKA04283.1 DNA-binding protein [Streptomyces noursei ZPM]AIA04043.1 DNA-binding protein [Streptomyces noursei]EOT03411.1 DNA-binding protein [Streptomyces noursei CCRC 11814]EXU87460.1 DNA-binding protein [Streptomyces noursei PD-1]UWS72673.1 helix-turn-helix transcriptional regulator [Streptomyces noursei]